MSISNKVIIKILMIYCILFISMRALIGKLIGNLNNIVFIISVFLLLFLYLLNYRNSNFKIKKNAFFLFLGLLFFYVFINLCFAPEASTYAFYEYVLYFLIPFSIAYTAQYIGFNWLFKMLMLVGVVDSLEAIWEFNTGNILFRTAYSGEQVVRRAFGLVGSPLTLAMLLTCTTLIAFYYAMYKDKKYFVCFIVNSVGLFCTQSRGPILSLIIGLIVIFYTKGLMSNANRAQSIVKRLILVLCCTFVCYYLLKYFSTKNTFLGTIYSRMQTILEWGSNNAANFERRNRWNYAINLFKNHILIGYGVSSTGPHASTGIITESGVLKVLCETGIVGFVLYFTVIYLGTFSNLKKCLALKAEFTPLVVGMVCAILFENIILQILESVSIFFVLSLCIVYLVGNTKKLYFI